MLKRGRGKRPEVEHFWGQSPSEEREVLRAKYPEGETFKMGKGTKRLEGENFGGAKRPC